MTKSKRIEREIYRISDELESEIDNGSYVDYLFEVADDHSDETYDDLLAILEARADGIRDFVRENYPERLARKSS